MNPYIIAAVALSISVTSAAGGYWLSSNIYQKQIAEQKADWSKQVADSQRERADALNTALLKQVEMQARNQEIDHEVKTKVDAVRASSSATVAGLRASLAKACRNRSMPTAPATAGRSNGEAYSDGLRDGIAEGLERRIAAPATIQTAHLIGAQRYITEVCVAPNR